MKKLIFAVMIMVIGNTITAQQRTVEIDCQNNVDTIVYNSKKGDILRFTFSSDDYLHYRHIFIEREITWYANCREPKEKTYGTEEDLYIPATEIEMEYCYDRVFIKTTKKSLLLKYVNWINSWILFTLLAFFIFLISSTKENVKKSASIVKLENTKNVLVGICITLAITIAICYLSFLRMFGDTSHIILLITFFIITVLLLFFIVVLYERKVFLDEK